MTLRLRPPGADLQRGMDPPAGEAGLILVLAGSLTLHHWRPLLGWLPNVLAHARPASFELTSGALLPRLAIATLALALPSASWLALTLALKALPTRRARPWLLLYALLPLLWGLMLAHHLGLGMVEAGKILPVSALGLLRDWTPGAWQSFRLEWLPSWSADPHVVAFCQTLSVLTGLAGSVLMLRRLLVPNLSDWILQGMLASGLALVGRALVAMG